MAQSRSSFLFTLDILLLCLFLALLAPRLTGLAVHEWLGIAFGLPVLVHLLMSWRWIAHSITKASTQFRWRSRVNLVLNLALFILVVLELSSGVGISAVALPRLHIGTVNDRTWRAVHNQSLNALHLVIGLHIAVNWSSLRRYLTSARPHG